MSTSDSEVQVSVLVPVLNEERYLPGSLDCILGQELTGVLEVLFIDGGSDDRTLEILSTAAEADPRVRVLANPAQRTPNGLNIGLEEARGDYVARMDAHTRYPTDYLALGIARLQRGDVAWVAGPQLAAGDGTWSRRIALALSTTFGTGGAQFRHGTGEEFDARSGFTGVWERKTLVAHGGWDEDWPINQDAELAARMLAAGERIVCVPSMAAAYIPRDSLGGLARQYHRYGFYRCKTSVRHPESMRTANLLPASVVLASIGAVVAVPRPLRRVGRWAVAAYLGAVAVESVRAAPRASRVTDVAALPLIFLTMHFANGLGFLRACLRFGPPLRAIRAIVTSKARGGPA